VLRGIPVKKTTTAQKTGNVAMIGYVGGAEFTSYSV